MRTLSVIASLCVALAFAITSASSSRAQISNDIIKIGVMADMNGPLSTAGGRGSVEAARMAAEDFGGAIAGKHIEIVSADHVDVITDLANSAVGFATRMGRRLPPHGPSSAPTPTPGSSSLRIMRSGARLNVMAPVRWRRQAVRWWATFGPRSTMPILAHFSSRRSRVEQR